MSDLTEKRTIERAETHACDCISREAAIDQLRQSYNLLDAEQRLEDLPSAQSTDADIQRMQDIEQAMLDKAYECGKQEAMQWIPCSERLPEYGGWYITTYRITEDNNNRVGLLWYSTLHGWEWDNAIAWMSLPKPYREDNHEIN